MQRGSDRLSVHRDDEMKPELKDLLRSGHPVRTEEWYDPEPSAEDGPEIWRGPVRPGTAARTSLESVRLELARLLGRHLFPAGPGELSNALRHGRAHDDLIKAVRRLPRSARYGSVQELAEAMTLRRR
ncbi:DUF2795 domain-containing protein [Streptomyces sp. NPDC006012]|uniref:DUF2795 domain-containing protein n=1 Tax=Streptomyces sp. NPDC006012 TaxID=3364739 RepID=UPI0036CC064A